MKNTPDRNWMQLARTSRDEGTATSAGDTQTAQYITPSENSASPVSRQTKLFV